MLASARAATRSPHRSLRLFQRQIGFVVYYLLCCAGQYRVMAGITAVPAADFSIATGYAVLF
jgi:hypothetical protein